MDSSRARMLKETPSGGPPTEVGSTRSSETASDVGDLQKNDSFSSRNSSETVAAQLAHDPTAGIVEKNKIEVQVKKTGLLGLFSNATKTHELWLGNDEKDAFEQAVFKMGNDYYGYRKPLVVAQADNLNTAKRSEGLLKQAKYLGTGGKRIMPMKFCKLDSKGEWSKINDEEIPKEIRERLMPRFE